MTTLAELQDVSGPQPTFMRCGERGRILPSHGKRSSLGRNLFPMLPRGAIQERIRSAEPVVDHDVNL